MSASALTRYTNPATLPQQHLVRAVRGLWDNGNPFDFMAQKYGKERALELACKLKANKPILSRSAAILTLIASGEAVLGATASTASQEGALT